MALIHCPECGAQISDKAVQCPHCGCPMTQQPECSTPEASTNAPATAPAPTTASVAPTAAVTTEPAPKKSNKTFIICVLAFVIAILLTIVIILAWGNRINNTDSMVAPITDTIPTAQPQDTVEQNVAAVPQNQEQSQATFDHISYSDLTDIVKCDYREKAGWSLIIAETPADRAHNAKHEEGDPFWNSLCIVDRYNNVSVLLKNDVKTGLAPFQIKNYGTAVLYVHSAKFAIGSYDVIFSCEAWATDGAIMRYNMENGQVTTLGAGSGFEVQMLGSVKITGASELVPNEGRMLYDYVVDKNGKVKSKSRYY